MEQNVKTTEKAGASQKSRHCIVTIDPCYKLEKVASKNQCRPSIENIKLANSKRFGNVAVATNGRAMAIVPVIIDEGENDCGLISPAALKAARQNKFLAGKLILNSKIEIPSGAILPRPEQADVGQYVNWEQCVPAADEKTEFTVDLNPQFLLDLAQAIGWEKGQAVRLQFYGRLNPIRVSTSTRSEGGYGVLMPCNLNNA